MSDEELPPVEQSPATPFPKTKPPRPLTPSSAVSSRIGSTIHEASKSRGPSSNVPPAIHTQQNQSLPSTPSASQTLIGGSPFAKVNPQPEVLATPGLTPQISKVEEPLNADAVVSAVNQDDRSPEVCTFGIIYKLACVDNTTTNRPIAIHRYNKIPFAGLDKTEARRSLSVMDVIAAVEGNFPPDQKQRKNQMREHLGTDRLEDGGPFELGKDFIVRQHTSRAVRIMCPFVIDFLKAGSRYYPKGIQDEELMIKEPYKLLAYNYKELCDRVNSVDSLATLEEDPSKKLGHDHLKIVLDWFQPYYEKELKSEVRLHGNGKSTYQNLWLLYKPGTIVYAGPLERIECYIVDSFQHPMIPLGKELIEVSWEWDLSLWRFDFDSNRLVRRSKAKEVKIQRFSGEKDIVKLPFIPLGFMEDSIKEKLIKRGRRHYSIIREAPVLRHYEGALSGNNALQYSGAVIIDPLRYFERWNKRNLLGTIVQAVDDDNDSRKSEEPHDSGGGEIYSRYNDLPISEAEPFEDEDMYLLLPAKVRGFALGKKQWAHFDTSSFKEPQSNAGKALDNLIIKPEDQESLQALASSALTAASNLHQTDFIDGKGLGKVILLHGPPGVGKTFTVECLAQYLGKPLLALTVADIGTDQSTIEEKLFGWLDLAQRWNAIVLLDEAETYLDRRGHGDLNRNALVTVFLRVLEYFPGLVFLTTNQPGFIDDAFISRLHLCIEYGELQAHERNRLWKSFLNKYRNAQNAETTITPKPQEQGTGLSDRLKIEIGADVEAYLCGIEEIKKPPLNGRDIRNVVDSAVKRAMYRASQANSNHSFSTVKVEIKDFRIFLENKEAFSDYIDRVAGKNEGKRAEGRGARAPVH